MVVPGTGQPSSFFPSHSTEAHKAHEKIQDIPNFQAFLFRSGSGAFIIGNKCGSLTFGLPRDPGNRLGLALMHTILDQTSIFLVFVCPCENLDDCQTTVFHQRRYFLGDISQFMMRNITRHHYRQRIRAAQKFQDGKIPQTMENIRIEEDTQAIHA
ncbi:MAG: hypothetical protein HQL76_09795 [Magnetococcales bacterium]|nr:hypothetical protein [Magnetococcales bacterium]